MGKPKHKSAKKIPPLFLDTRAIADKAESDKGLLVYESMLADGVLISDGTDVIITTARNGYLVVHKSSISNLITELINVKQDMERNIWNN